jgi:hypothetical protein
MSEQQEKKRAKNAVKACQDVLGRDNPVCDAMKDAIAEEGVRTRRKKKRK